MNTYEKIGSVLALVLGSSVAANAAIFYDNLPNNPGSISGGLGLSGEGYFGANQFSTSSLCTSGCTLGNITLNLSSSSSSTSGFQLQVVADNANTPSGALITYNNPAEFTTDFGNNLFTPSGTFNLAPSTNYWVKFISSSNNGSLVYWGFQNNPSQLGPNQPELIAYDLGAGVETLTNPTFLMKVEATPNSVPVPGAIWMMGSALIGLVSSWRKKAR